MHVKFYCDLYVSRCWQKKKRMLMKKLEKKKLLPSVYIISLSQGKQNQLEIFSSVLLHQHVYDNTELFVVGIVDGYDEGLLFTQKMAEKVYEKTGAADIRHYILERQQEFEKTGR